MAERKLNILDCYTDLKFLSQFCQDRPISDYIDNPSEHNQWNSLYNFFKSSSNLIINCKNVNQLKKEINNRKELIILKSFVTNRGSTRLEINPNKFRPLRKVTFQNEFSNPRSLFLIGKESLNQKEKQTENNGFLICTENDYLNSWNRLNLNNSDKKP